MAIAYDSSSVSLITNGTTGTFSHTCSGSNRYLFVLTDSGSTSVTHDGVALTKLNSNIITSNSGFSFVDGISVWGLANPATGAKNISVTVPGSRNDSVVAVSYTGVDPNAAESYAPNQTNGNRVTQQTDYINTSTNNAWVATFIKGTDNLGRNFTAGASTTLRQTYANGSNNYAAGILDSNAAKTPAGQFSLVTNWSSGSGWFSSLMYSIKPYLAVTLTGPSSGNVNSASTNFTLTPDVAITGTVTITPSGAGSSGLSPTVLTFSNSSTAQTFTITPLTSGAITLTVTNTTGLNNAAPIVYTANAVVPTAPTIGTAIPLNASASVAFIDNSDGGSAITNHTATSTPGSFTGTSATSPITVSGLSNGTPYTFVVKATNAVGDSSNSSASNSVTPYVPASSYTFTGPTSGNVRSASTDFTVTPNSTYLGTVTITPTGAGSTGLEPVVLTWNLSSAAQTFTITPLASGAITLTPTNSNGISNAANITYTAAAVVPLGPVIGLATPSSGGAFVSFSAPTNDGGSTITLYTVTSSPGGVIATSPYVGTVNIVGLTNGTPYTFTVKATNAIGQSSASSASNEVTPTESSTSFTNSGPKFTIDRGVGNLITF